MSSLAGMAQDVFQMPGVWHDIKYEELQRLRQTTLLQCVSFVNEICIYHIDIIITKYTELL